jgi:hypothetical protein
MNAPTRAFVTATLTAQIHLGVTTAPVSRDGTVMDKLVLVRNFLVKNKTK